jgi:hypothetical protein
MLVDPDHCVFIKRKDVVWVSAALFFPCKIMARRLRQPPYWQQYSIFQVLNRIKGQDLFGCIHNEPFFAGYTDTPCR